ncbi:MAG TPA: hypothetical protein VG497_25710 [Kribbella sp.]|nr:hypothetical protein [Kribbella sp.]
MGVALLGGLVAVDLVGIATAFAAGSSTSERAWCVAALVVSLVGYAIALSWLCLGINAARPILMDPERLYVPAIGLRTGVTHVTVPLTEVAGVEMVYRSAPRNGRWQLSIIRMHDRNLASDSLTSARGPRRGITGTRAAEVAESLRRALPPRGPS